MKKALLVLLFLTCFYRAWTQQKKIDSLKHIEATKEDTSRINRFRAIAFLFYNINLDSAYFYTNQGLSLAKKIGDKIEEARCEKDLGAIFLAKGNYPRALNCLLTSLKQLEATKNINEITGVLNQMSDFYYEQDDPARMLEYSKKAYKISQPLKSYDFILSALDIGYDYIELKHPDSALTYLQQGFNYAEQIKVNDKHSLNVKNYLLAYANDGLGIVTGLSGAYNKALYYYHLGISYDITTNSQTQLCYVYRSLSKMFKQKGDMDSCLLYANKALTAAYSANNSAAKLETYKLFTHVYQGIDNQITIAYFNKISLLTDSIHSAEKNKEVENLNFDEKERQRQLAEQAKRDEETRRENLQLLAIALFIPLFLLILLWLSRTKTHRRVIEFMSVLSLLLVFEFITLLIHPWIEKLTNHTPVSELIILVALAAILIPLHHNLTHWLKEKLVQSKVIPAAPIETDDQVE